MPTATEAAPTAARATTTEPSPTSTWPSSWTRTCRGLLQPGPRLVSEGRTRPGHRRLQQGPLRLQQGHRRLQQGHRVEPEVCRCLQQPGQSPTTTRATTTGPSRTTAGPSVGSEARRGLLQPGPRLPPQGRLRPGHPRLQQSHRLDPNYAAAYNSRGFAYFQNKAYDKAWADVKKCQELGGSIDPDFLQKLRQASGRNE